MCMVALTAVLGEVPAVPDIMQDTGSLFYLATCFLVPAATLLQLTILHFFIV